MKNDAQLVLGTSTGAFLCANVAHNSTLVNTDQCVQSCFSNTRPM